MKTRIQERLLAYDQRHLLRDLDALHEEQLERLAFQLDRWSEKSLQQQRASWQNPRAPLVIEPFPMKEEPMLQEKPFKKTAVLFLAGGQGSRLGFEGPKGCYPLFGKSLFERHCEKMKSSAPIAILTSLLNHQEVISFFEEKSCFGRTRPAFFPQSTLPLLNDEGHWMWREPGNIAEGPDGNGSVFAAMQEHGLIDRFEGEGIETVHIVPIDNPLADPLDETFSAHHEKSGAELSVKCIRLQDAKEPMGRLVQIDGQLVIVESSELSEVQQQECLYANTNLFAMDLAFIKRLSKEDFPLHWARRTMPIWENKKIIRKEIWKAERFIVDACFYTKKTFIHLSARESCYAALKEKKSIGELEKRLMV